MTNEHNIDSQFNACMHKEYCLSLKAKIRPLDENAPPAAAPAPAVPSVLKRGYGRLIQAAADLALQQFMPSDIVDDYPSKTISAAKVAKMMTQPRDRLRLLSIEVSEGAKQMIAATPAAPSQPVTQGEPVAFAWRAKKGQPSAWQVCFDLKQAADAEVLAKTEIRFMSWTTPAAPSQEPALTGCNCRWGGDTQVQWCELHLAHKDAIHEWAERAKTAEAKLAQLSTSQEPVTLTDEEIEELQWRVPAARNSTTDALQIRTTRQMTLFARAIIAALREKEARK